MQRTTLYLPIDLQRALQEAARRLRRSQAALIREALHRYLDGLERPRPRSLGRGTDRALAARDSEAWLARAWERR